MEPSYVMKSRQYFAELLVTSLYETEKEQLLQELLKVDFVGVTTDGWTSRNTESYITITCHFVNDKWDMCNYVLQTRIMSQSHTGENLAAELNQAFCEWNIMGKVVALVTDNASNMVSCSQEISLPRIGCFAHTLNLASQRALKIASLSKMLAKIRRIVQFFHKSSTATVIFRQKQSLLQLPNHKLIQDVVTRWNSTFEMVQRYLEQQAAVQATLVDKDLRKKERDMPSLTDTEITSAEELVKVLEPMKTATTLMCDEKIPTLSIVYPLFQKLINYFSDHTTTVTASPSVAEVKRVIRDDLAKRYQEPASTEILIKAAALDPRFKALPFLDQEKRSNIFITLTTEAVSLNETHFHIKNEPTDDSDEEVNPPLPQLPHLPDDLITPDPEPNDNATEEAIPLVLPTLKRKMKQQPTQKIDISSSNTDPEKKPKVESAMENLFGDVYVTKVEMAPKTKYDLADLEVKEYIREKPLALNQNPLVWWKAHQDKFPLLARLARKYLGIPGTSVPSERVFSTVGDVVSAQRAALKAEHVDSLIFLNKNMKI